MASTRRSRAWTLPGPASTRADFRGFVYSAAASRLEVLVADAALLVSERGRLERAGLAAIGVHPGDREPELAGFRDQGGGSALTPRILPVPDGDEHVSLSADE